MVTGEEGALREVASGELLLLGNLHTSHLGHTTLVHHRMRVERWPRVMELGKRDWASACCLVTQLSLELMGMTKLGPPRYTVMVSEMPAQDVSPGV